MKTIKQQQQVTDAHEIVVLSILGHVIARTMSDDVELAKTAADFQLGEFQDENWVRGAVRERNEVRRQRAAGDSI